MPLVKLSTKTEATSISDTTDAQFHIIDAFATTKLVRRITLENAISSSRGKINLVATTAPTVTDDSAAGYSVGSFWLDVTNDEAYVCLDATATAAVWIEITNTVAVATYSAGWPTRPNADLVFWVSSDEEATTPGAASGDDIVILANPVQNVNAQVGTTYTLAASDAAKLVTLNNAAAITLSLPQDSDATIPIGSYGDIYQLGAGVVTVAPGTGATVNTPPGQTLVSAGQYASIGWQKVSANTYRVFGNLVAA